MRRLNQLNSTFYFINTTLPNLPPKRSKIGLLVVTFYTHVAQHTEILNGRHEMIQSFKNCQLLVF